MKTVYAPNPMDARLLNERSLSNNRIQNHNTQYNYNMNNGAPRNMAFRENDG